MKVALNTDGLYTNQAGTARYIRGLIRGFKRAAPRDLEISELAWPVENFGYAQPERSLKTLYRELVWAKLIAPGRIRAQGADVLHSTAGYFIEPPAPVRNVVTLHDLALIRFPGRFRPWQRWSGQRRLQMLTRADRIICISRFTADEAVACLDLSASKLEVVHHGCDFHPEEGPVPETPPDFEVPAEFLLFVGSLEPGKNLALLKEVYETARSNGRSLPPLLVAGARWEGVAGEGEPPAQWRYLGRQPDGVLAHLYRHALAFVFPSKYEGFGLPVLEAMSLGCPVLCSPVASLREVGGEAALYADQTPEAYLQAMTRLLSEPGLRESLIERGKAWAGRFSWRKCAEQTAEAYRR